MTKDLQVNLPFEDKLNNKKFSPVSNFFYFLSALIIRVILRINGGLRITGRENIPQKGGVIIAANHISYLDPPLTGAVLQRRATFMARKGLFDIPLLGWFIKHYAFPIDREKTLPSTIKEAVNRLKNGEVIIMFPEGKRSETGKLLEAKRGIGMIACLSRAPIIPTLIIGSNKALPVDAKWLRRAKISVIFGKPIVPPEGKSDAVYENTSKKIMYEIGELKKHYADYSG